jgi:hypothetical protein
MSKLPLFKTWNQWYVFVLAFSPTNCMFRLDYKLLFLEPIKKTAAVQCSFLLLKTRNVDMNFMHKSRWLLNK